MCLADETTIVPMCNQHRQNASDRQHYIHNGIVDRKEGTHRKQRQSGGCTHEDYLPPVAPIAGDERPQRYRSDEHHENGVG